MYWIDTDVISEARKQDRANLGVLGFFKQAAAQNEPICLSVVTCNTADFQSTGVRLKNPFLAA